VTCAKSKTYQNAFTQRKWGGLVSRPVCVERVIQEES